MLGDSRFDAADTDTWNMVRRGLVALLTVVAFVPSLGHPAAAASAAYRPDAFIKLCGVNSGCLIDPLPHPWVGNNVYNETGYHQKVHHSLDNGRGIRFWINFQNDGTQTDTYSLNGCKGNKNFEILQVIVGKVKVPTGPYEAPHIEDQFKADTWKVKLQPGAHVAITLNILTDNPNLTYNCPMTITSAGDPTKQDTVVASITTF
jgi:hypothetical protein